MKPNDPVIWDSCVGGYQLLVPILARVIKVHPKRVTIRVWSVSEKKWVKKVVVTESLSPISEGEIKQLEQLERNHETLH